MKTQNPGCVAYCGSWKSGPIGGLGCKISVGCGGRNATAVHPGVRFFSGTALRSSLYVMSCHEMWISYYNAQQQWRPGIICTPFHDVESTVLNNTAALFRSQQKPFSRTPVLHIQTTQPCCSPTASELWSGVGEARPEGPRVGDGVLGRGQPAPPTN